MKVAYAPIYKYELPEGHRFPMVKYELLPQQLLHEGVITVEDFMEPSMLSEKDLLLTHTAEYWRKLQTLNLTRKEIRDIGFPVRAELVHRGRFIAQGTIDCCYEALANGVALNIAGGTHHAYADRGGGFCVFNDFAIAANHLLSQRLVERILIFDLDVHQGDGTAYIFRDNPQVFTCSIHGEKNYPLRKEKSDLDVGLPDKTNDEIYLQTVKQTLPHLIHSFRPDLILYLAGVDILTSDKLGRLSLTLKGCKERDRFVFSTAHQHQIPIAVSMGGGYSEQISTIIDAHTNTYKAARQVFI